MTIRTFSLLLALLAGAPAAGAGTNGAAVDSLPFESEEAGLPRVDATLAPDGHFTVVIRADVAWSVAELSVGGSPAFALGPSKAGYPVHVAGVTDSRGTLDLSLTAVDAAARGILWMFSVEPTEVPAAAPPFTPTTARKRRGLFGWLGGGA